MAKKGLQKYVPPIIEFGHNGSLDCKKTLARALFPGYAYVNLENLDDRLAAGEGPLRFLRPHSSTGMIVDEAQKAPSLFSYLHGIVDESGETLNENYFIKTLRSKGIKPTIIIPNTHGGQ